MHKMKKLSYVIGIFVLSVAVLAACGGGGNTAPAPTPAPTDQPPAADGEVGNADLIAVGEQTVQKSCISCHGTDLQGGMGGKAPSLHGLTLSKEEIIDIVTNGRGAMPAGTAKGNEEAVAEYILTLK